MKNSKISPTSDLPSEQCTWAKNLYFNFKLVYVFSYPFLPILLRRTYEERHTTMNAIGTEVLTLTDTDTYTIHPWKNCYDAPIIRYLELQGQYMNECAKYMRQIRESGIKPTNQSLLEKELTFATSGTNLSLICQLHARATVPHVDQMFDDDDASNTPPFLDSCDQHTAMFFI